MSGRLVRWSWVIPIAVVGLTAFTAGPAQSQQSDDQTSAEPAPERVDGTGLGLGAVSMRDVPAVAAPPRAPTEVAIRVDVVQVLLIDELRSRFEVDAIVTARWVDERGVADCEARQVHHGESAVEMLKTTVWAPSLVVEDGRGPRKTMALELGVSCDGKTTYQERFTTAVTQRFTNLNDFPFDDQTIEFKVAPFGLDGRRAVRFVALTDSQVGENLVPAKRASKYESEEWRFTPEPGELATNPPSITTFIGIDRETGFYWWNIIGPLILIVAISWIVFWMKPVLHERLGVSITVLLTVVAFDFLTGDSLPRLPFTTRIDQFYNVSYLFVGASIVITLVATVGVERWRRRSWRKVVTAAADRSGSKAPWWINIDRISRVAFPPSYILAVVLVVMLGAASPGRDQAASEREVTEEVSDTESEGLPKLVPGTPVSDAIRERGERDEYTICGDPETTVTVTMRRQTLEDQSLDPLLVLFTDDDDPENRERIASDDDGAGGLDSLLGLPPGEGCYVLVAGDRFEEGTGNYTLTAEAEVAASQIDELVDEYGEVADRFGAPLGDLVDDVIDLPPLEPLTGTISEPGQAILYRVCSEGDPGGFVLMERSLESTEGEIDPLLVLYGLDGSFENFDDDGTGDLDSLLELPAGDSCYLLAASDLSGLATGGFTIVLLSE